MYILYLEYIMKRILCVCQAHTILSSINCKNDTNPYYTDTNQRVLNVFVHGTCNIIGGTYPRLTTVEYDIHAYIYHNFII